MEHRPAEALVVTGHQTWAISRAFRGRSRGSPRRAGRKGAPPAAVTYELWTFKFFSSLHSIKLNQTYKPKIMLSSTAQREPPPCLWHTQLPVSSVTDSLQTPVCSS